MKKVAFAQRFCAYGSCEHSIIQSKSAFSDVTDITEYKTIDIVANNLLSGNAESGWEILKWEYLTPEQVVIQYKLAIRELK